MKHLFWLTALSTLLYPWALLAQHQKSAIRAINAQLNEMARTEHLSGVVLIARNNQILLHKAYGFANRADQVPNLLNTRFNMASMNKMFTGMAILQLAESHKISLEKTIGSYLPDYSNKAVADSVTIHQLLTHTSGLGNFWEELEAVSKGKYRTTDDYIHLFADKPLLFKPGSRYYYSNSGYIILGKIIERISGQSYVDYVRDHILVPAQMTDTDALELDKVHPRVATGYSMSSDVPGQWTNNNYVNVIKGGPAGGYYTTASDLLRFSYAVTDNLLLNKASTNLYVTGKIAYEKGSYAYGTSVDRINGYGIFGHTGGHFGIANEFFVCPELGYTVVVLTNGEVENYWDVSNLIKTCLLGSSVASENFYFTKKVMKAIVNGDEEASVAVMTDDAKAHKLRESVIDRWAWHLLFDKKTREALALFRFNVKCFPESAGALYSLAEGYRVTNAKDKAKLIYEQYLKLAPDDAEVREKVKTLNK